MMLQTNSLVTVITLSNTTWMFNEGEISKFQFGDNFDHARRFLQEANSQITEEREYLTRDRVCISCCCLCACLTIIGSPCFCCWAYSLGKEVLKNTESIKNKLRLLIDAHRAEFNSNGCEVLFKEMVQYVQTTSSRNRPKQVTVYYLEFTFAKNTSNFPQISNNQTNNYPGHINNQGYDYNNNPNNNVYHIDNRNDNNINNNQGGIKVSPDQGNVYINPNTHQGNNTSEWGPVDNHNVYVNPNYGGNTNVNPNPNNDPSIKPIIADNHNNHNTNNNNNIENYEYDQTSGPINDNKPKVYYD